MDLLPATLLQQKLDYYLHHPGLLVPEVRKEFEALKLKFPDIICRLTNMNTSLRDQNVRAWRQALKDLDDKVDDIMIFILSLMRSPLILGFGHHQLPFIFRRFHLKKQLMEVRRLGEQIQNIQTDRTPSVPDNACKSSTQAKERSSTSLGSRSYGVRPSAYEMTGGRITKPIHADTANRIEDLLLNHRDERFKVVGVIGRKGIGKSRLVTHVYKEKVRKYYDCYAWISNPSSFQPESTLREMIRQFYFGSPPYTLETMDQSTLLSAMDKCLDGKRFLLVLDGVSDLEIWESVIFPAFPFGRDQLARPSPKSSFLHDRIVFAGNFLHGRIVFTSSFSHRRIFEVVKQVYVQIRLNPLSQEEAWAIFCQLVFPETQPPGTCPPELENMARRITQKSGGLLSVIQLLAGVLRQGKSSPAAEVWEKHLRQLEELDKSFYRDDTVVKAIILLSYAALALPLKSCFLYFSIFPKDDEIPLKRAIRLWIAEGLVEETPEKTATEASMAYLQELIDRELIQPGNLDVKGDVKSFKFDDQVRRVALDIINGSHEQQLCFVDQATDNNGSSSSSSSGSTTAAGMPTLRLLSIRDEDVEDITSMHKNNNAASRVRSCIISGMGKLQSSIIMHRCLSRFQLLRVLDLDLQGSEIKTLPNSLGTLVLLVYLRLKGSKLKEVSASALKNLICLKYLGLRRTGIRELPAASLLQLKELHTLDVRETKLRRLPCCVSQLLQLRHIYLCSSFRREVVEMPLIGKETDDEERPPLQLQTLAGVRATTNLIEELGRWTQLRKLSMGRLAEADSEMFCASIDKMNFLRSLSIRCGKKESLRMRFLGRSNTTLDTLRIGGSVEALDSAIKCFPSLCRLYLWDNLLTDDPFPMLQGLPNLMVLSLTNTFKGKKIISCDTGGFPKLKRLSIFQLRNLEHWQINGGMQKLEFLSFGHCPNLKKPPQDLKNLPSLHLVIVAGMDEDFNEMMERIGKESKASFKVRHIPLFKHDFRATEQKPGTKLEEVSEADGLEDPCRRLPGRYMTLLTECRTILAQMRKVCLQHRLCEENWATNWLAIQAASIN
ncbi:disease resistance protein RPM1-like [Telopea speciosissima]|uniref:disease resistance protein RPM1-like n=1 Tax=Telopea speciosissima TaxID=54955 RepID=UPI001CC7AD38|nr:disease resistance protein RPM1-like [Telopea speciosissima]